MDPLARPEYLLLLLAVCSEEVLASTTPDPEPSPPSPCCAEPMPEPTDDGEPELAATDEPLLHGATELRIAKEPELCFLSDQVREPAITPVTREKAVASEITEKISGSVRLLLPFGSTLDLWSSGSTAACWIPIKDQQGDSINSISDSIPSLN